MRVVIPSLLAIAFAAGEPLTATPWDVRKDADELLDDLERKRADPHELIERTRRLLEAHGDALVGSGDGAAPLAEVLWARLEGSGLAPAFAAAAAAAAERGLREADPGDAAALAALARRAPGTPAARSAWRRAADLAWDSGQLARYLDRATAAGDRADADRRRRLELAAALGAAPPASLPASFDGIGQMWRLPLEFTRGDEPDPDLPARRRQPPQTVRPALSEPADTALAASDGRQLVVIDHLTGTPLGRRLTVGNRALPTRSARPERIPGGFAAAGIDQQGRLVVVAADAAGGESWRSHGAGEDIAAISAPVLCDGLLAIAHLRMDDDRCTLELSGFSAADGSLRWTVPVALLPVQNLFGGGEWSSPSLCRHARGLAVLSNAGVIGLVGSDGAPLRLLSYPHQNSQQLGPGGPRPPTRSGMIVSDGLTAVASPIDQPGMTLILDPAGDRLRSYRGDGAEGEILAVAGSDALLAGRQATLVDLAELRPRWSVPARVTAAAGGIGTESVLVAGADQVLLLARADGRPLGGRALPRPAAVAPATGVLVVADGVEARGFGDAGAFLQRLEAAIAAAPEDPRPLAALAGVLAGRGDGDRAIACYLRALRLGADAGVGERAARLVRVRLDDADPAVAAHAVAALAELAQRLPAMADELPFWTARLAEARGDRAGALDGYRRVQAGTDRSLPLAEGLTPSLRLLAAAGIARLDPQAPAPMPPPSATVAPPPAVAAWSRELHRSGAMLPSGGLVVTFADGLLSARRLADGSEAWFRAPLRPVLGVQSDPGRPAAGVPINVIPGTAAHAAGLRNGDVLLSLNGAPLRDFEADLRPAVLALGVGAEVTFAVEGTDGPRTVRGRIGGEPVEPIAASAGVVLARATMPTSPDRSDLRFFVLDAATGRQRWAHTLPADRNRMESLRPLLAPGDVVVAADGPDLAGLDGGDGRRRWTLAGRADLLAGARPLAGCLWLRERTGGTAHLLDPRSGMVLATIPNTDPDAALPVLDGTEVVVRELDGRLACWDLGRGRLRFRTTGDWISACALRGDTLVAVDGQGRLCAVDRANGTLRRQILDNAMVRTVCVGEKLLLALAERDGRQALAAVALDGGVGTWQVRLPLQVEVVGIAPAGSGFLVRLRDAAANGSLLLLDRQGEPRLAHGLGGDPAEAVALADGSGVLAGTTGAMRLLLPERPAVPPPLVPTDLGSGEARAALAGLASRLAWQDHPGGSWAIARNGGNLVLAVRSQGDTAIRIADALEPLAADAVLALANPEGMTRTAVGGAWSVADAWAMPDPRGGGTLACSLWRPLPGRSPGAPVRLHLGSDVPGRPPWWLALVWHQAVLSP